MTSIKAIGSAMKKLLVTSFIFCLPLTFLQAQQLQPDITIQSERLEPSDQSNLQNLQYDLEQYIESYEYTDNAYGTEIPFIVQVYMQSANESGSETIYSATLVVTNGSDQRYFDNSWEFPYKTGTVFQHNIYHPVTGIIDFYAYLVIAGEVDTYGKLAGTPYYNQALEITNKARRSSFSSGWRDRVRRLDDLKNHRDFRLLKFSFFDAYWDYQESNVRDAQIGFTETLNLLDKIFQVNSDDKYTKIFFKDIGKLNILNPTIVAKATDHIKEMIELIKKIEKNGYTYKGESGNIYFDTSKFKNYGKLAKLKLEVSK
jgi:hypothetical protein